MQYCPTCNRQYEGDDFVKCPYDGSNLSPVDQAGTDPLIGTRFGDAYQVVRIIGEGGMGRVYEARHVRLSKRYAVKILHPQYNSNEQTIARFRREAEAASAIGHENILDVIDFNSTPEGVYYIVTEYLEGRSLARAFAEDGIMKVPRALSILHQCARALKAAHAHEIVHRDLKPENIFLVSRFETDDFVKVLDFGISKVRSGEDRLTQAGQIIGTPHYMSPEQAQGELNLDHRSDVYSLGAIMYEMFTARLPFEAGSVQQILVQLLTEEPAPPRAHKPDLPEDVEAVILKCMAKDPAKRYQTMAELDQAIGVLYSHHVGGAISTPASTAGLQATGEQPARPGAESALSTGPSMATGGGAPPGPGLGPASSPGLGPASSPGLGPASSPGLGPASSPGLPAGSVTGGWGAAGSRSTPDPVGQHIEVQGSRKGGALVAVLGLLLALAVGGGALWYFVLRDRPSGPDVAHGRDDGSGPRGGSHGMRPAQGMRQRAMAPSAVVPPAMRPGGRVVAERPAPLRPGPRSSPGEMLLIKGGTFTMGRKGGSDREGPPQEGVKVEDFLLDVAEVSCGDYARYLAGPGKGARSPWDGSRRPKESQRSLPVTQVTWREAKAYCEALGKRLPTEKEWEYAARGPSHKRLYPWGDRFDASKVVSSVLRPAELEPVRAGSPVGGLYHMLGNAWEWVADRYRPYPGSKAKRAFGTQYVIRGGGAESKRPKELTATWREFNYGHRNPRTKKLAVYRFLGFRCARSPRK